MLLITSYFCKEIGLIELLKKKVVTSLKPIEMLQQQIYTSTSNVFIIRDLS